MVKLIYSLSILTVIITANIDSTASIIMFMMLYFGAMMHGLSTDKRYKSEIPSNNKEFSSFVRKTKGYSDDDSFIQIEYDEETETYNQTKTQCHT